MKKNITSIVISPLVLSALHFVFDVTWPIWILAVALWFGMIVISFVFGVFTKLGEGIEAFAMAVAGSYTNGTFKMVTLLTSVISLVALWHAGFGITFLAYLIFTIIMTCMRLYGMLRDA